jgi:hypothetical protein
LNAQKLFKKSNGLARAGLGEADALGRTRDAAVLGDGNNRSPMHEVHHGSRRPYVWFPHH